MKLSEAIRLGAMVHPQGFGEYFTLDGASCAIGAAMEAVACQEHEDEIFELWPILRSPRPTYPAGADYVPIDVFDAITELNDEDRWTRERIADWVETVERAQETQSELTTAAP